MNALSHWRSRPRMILMVLIGLVAGHAILLYVLRQTGMSHAGVSGVVVSGLVLLVVAKHLGLLAALVRAVHGLFRRRFHNGKPDA
jgi:hypothetical protein